MTSKIPTSSVEVYDGKNLAINGDFDIWQRGTTYVSNSVSQTYRTADRWIFRTKSPVQTTFYRIAFPEGQTEVPDNPKYHLRTVIGPSPTDGVDIIHLIEHGATRLAGSDITISFWMRTNNPAAIFDTYIGTITDNLGFDAQDDPLQITGIQANVWKRVERTVYVNQTIDTANNKDHFELLIRTLNTPANTTFDIAHVQIEQGKHATNFEHRPIGEELRLCQRYYTKSYQLDTALGSQTSIGKVSVEERRITPYSDIGWLSFPTTMRVRPSLTLYSPNTGAAGQVRDVVGGVDRSVAGIFHISERGFSLIQSTTNFSIHPTDNYSQMEFHYVAECEIYFLIP
jgi:hypothetical protein